MPPAATPTCLLDEAIELSYAQRRQLEMHFQLAPFHAADAQTRASAHALLLHSRISETELATLENCRYIGVRAHNTDYVPAQCPDQLTVQGIPQLGAQSVAEHTFALIFALAKNLRLGHQQTVDGTWRGQMPLNMELHGKKLGIIGYGNIGKRVGQIGQALGLEVLVAAKPGSPGCSACSSLEDVLQSADILTIHRASQPGAAPWLNAERLALLQPHALLINTARGSLIDYDVLGKMVEAGKLGGVGLDVYPSEPPDLAWLNHPRVLCSPHLAYATDSTLAAMNQVLVEQLLAWHLTA